ncbi:hypothetical protein FANTH_13512 [Fusarium anthophilum]|uniref:Uncharacterized protein n=1 Tax=Fusarium anthophilum TaxID=48485 RepID=A0A8H4YN00_9HYPO|nr:hypothetical protein FANTH_13512 [Fusarium anthophilum]
MLSQQSDIRCLPAYSLDLYQYNHFISTTNIHPLYFLLFMFNLARATPITLGDSSLDSLSKLLDDDSIPVVDDPDFFNLGHRNAKSQKKHEKRAGPPYHLPYVLWKVTFERKKGDAGDFKVPGWIFGFPWAADRWGAQPASPWDIVVAPGVNQPLPLIGTSNGDLWYATNSYFYPFMRGTPPLATRRTYTEYTSWALTGLGFKFSIIRTPNDYLARGNLGARVGVPGKGFQPTDGYIHMNFKPNLTGVVHFSDPGFNYDANITGVLIQQGKTWV